MRICKLLGHNYQVTILTDSYIQSCTRCGDILRTGATQGTATVTLVPPAEVKPGSTITVVKPMTAKEREVYKYEKLYGKKES